MARSRNIKPSFFTNEQVADNCPLGRLLFIGLWTEADFNGNIEWKPRTLKVKLLPFDECDLEKLAINLDNSGLIRFYSVAGRTYLNIPEFKKHQNPHKNEKEKGTEIPDFSKELMQDIDLKGLAINRDKSRSNRDENGTHPADSLFLIPDSLILNPDTSTTDIKENNKEKPTPSAVFFDEFWNEYPATSRRIAKTQCRQKWEKKNLDEIAGNIIAHVRAMKKTESWKTGFEPSTLTYINQARWEGFATPVEKQADLTKIVYRGKEMTREEMKQLKAKAYAEGCGYTR